MIQNAAPEPNVRIQKFIHYVGTPQKGDRVTMGHVNGYVNEMWCNRVALLTLTQTITF